MQNKGSGEWGYTTGVPAKQLSEFMAQLYPIDSRSNHSVSPDTVLTIINEQKEEFLPTALSLDKIIFDKRSEEWWAKGQGKNSAHPIKMTMEALQSSDDSYIQKLFVHCNYLGSALVQVNKISRDKDIGGFKTHWLRISKKGRSNTEGDKVFCTEGDDSPLYQQRANMRDYIIDHSDEFYLQDQLSGMDQEGSEAHRVSIGKLASIGWEKKRSNRQSLMIARSPSGQVCLCVLRGLIADHINWCTKPRFTKSDPQCTTPCP